MLNQKFVERKNALDKKRGKHNVNGLTKPGYAVSLTS